MGSLGCEHSDKMAEAPAAWEVSVRKALPKDEHIVFAVLGFWGGVYAFSKVAMALFSSPAKPAVTAPVAAPAPSSGGAELTEENADTFFEDAARVEEWAKNLK